MSEQDEHLMSPGKYLRILLALMALLIVTVVMTFINIDDFTRAHHLGSGWNTAIAMTIAIIKALLIFLFFMHVKYATRLTWAFAAAGFVWLMIMLSLTMNDYLTRNHIRDASQEAAYRLPMAESQEPAEMQMKK